MSSFPVLVFLGCFLVSSGYPHSHEWTKLILTHHWPQTFCTMEHCQTDVNYWTLHGLWPDLGNACNASWHFNESLIADLMPDMLKSWPDILRPASTSFWKYEWLKHGTCAAKAETLNSEHKYFSKALELYHKLDLNGVLGESYIVPSEEFYSLDQVQGAFLKSYGVKPKIQCLHQGQNGQFQTLGQIEICMDREFQLVSCEHWSPENSLRGSHSPRFYGFRVCDSDVPVYYPPLAQRALIL